MRWIRLLAWAMAIAVALSACGAETNCDIVPGDELADSPDPVPFHLWVSNQSFEVDPVQIEVYIDDQQVVCDTFRVESQHTWILIELELDSGQHSLRVLGLDNQVELVESFTVSDEHWGLVEFWTEEGRRFFTFHIQDEPIGFA